MEAVLSVRQPQMDDTPVSIGETHKRCMSNVTAHKDRDAFKMLFLHFGPRIKSMMLKSGADHALAEDLAQEAMMAVWRKSHLYVPGRGAVSTWIFTIARNIRIDRLRRGSSRPYEDIDDVEVASEEADAEQNVASLQEAEQVALALQDLPMEQRQIIELAYIHDLPQGQIAEKLNLPLGTVKSRMRLAYGKLRAVLEELK